MCFRPYLIRTNYPTGSITVSIIISTTIKNSVTVFIACLFDFINLFICIYIYKTTFIFCRRLSGSRVTSHPVSSCVDKALLTDPAAAARAVRHKTGEILILRCFIKAPRDGELI